MPDGRFLSKTISHSEQLAGVSMQADYLFTRCIPHLDRDGRMTGNPQLVKATACPLREEITSGSIPDLLRQLAGAGLVRWYEADGKQVLQFPGFSNHQRGMKYDREAPSRYPPMDNATDLAEVRTNSGPTPDEVRLSRSLSEVEVEVTDTIADAIEAPPRDKQSPDDGGSEPEPAGGPSDTEVHATLAPLIREHLWRGSKPPPTSPGWNLGRDLQLAKRLMASDGITLDEMADVIRFARDKLGEWASREQLTMKIFNTKGRGDRLEDVLGYVRKRNEQEAGRRGLKQLDSLLA